MILYLLFPRKQLVRCYLKVKIGIVGVNVSLESLVSIVIPINKPNKMIVSWNKKGVSVE